MRRKRKLSSFIFPQMRNISHEKESSWRWAVQAVISVKADNKIGRARPKLLKSLKVVCVWGRKGRRDGLK